MSNGQRLFVFVPEVLFKLDGLPTLGVNLLALVAAFGEEGLRLSNNRLAEFFNVERGTIIDNINRLRDKRYVTDKGEREQKRRIVASSVILALLDSTKKPMGGIKMIPEVVSKRHKTGVKTPPINKEKEENTSTASPSPSPYGASTEASSIAPQETVMPLEDRRKLLDNIPDSPFKQAILAKRR